MVIEVKTYYKKPDGSDDNLKEHYFLKDGKKDGLSLTYYPNGKLFKSENYKSGIYDGPFIVYYDTGHLNTEINFVNGKITGNYKDYYPNGSLKIDAMYEDGLKAIHKDFHIGPENGVGNLKVIVCCENGAFHGPYRSYYDIIPGTEPTGYIESSPHGPLKEESNDYHGKPHGIVKHYHPNGKIMRITLMNHGIPRGISKIYNEAGDVIQTINYDDPLSILQSLRQNF